MAATSCRTTRIRVLATQAYTGRRKDMFRGEFLAALKMLQDGIPREKMRSSWGGAMGLTQFLPSEFYKHAVDFDGDGKVDIWTSIPDALASAAKQLANKGWQRGERWAYEVRMPGNVDCTIAQPGHVMPIGEWLKRGYAPAYGRKLAPDELKNDASLLLPEGTYGPAFLTPKNYFVIKDYNFSDLYVLFVGHLSDRILDGRSFERPWSKNTQLRTEQVEAMQRTLTERGLYADKIDGKAGMLTRAALGAYQKANGLKLDCWPTAEVLDAHAKVKNEKPGGACASAGSEFRSTCGRSVTRAEEPRTAPADHVAVRIAERTARPVAAGAAIGRGHAIRIRLVAGHRIVGSRIGVGRTRARDRAADDGAGREAADDAKAHAAAATTPRASAVVGAKVANGQHRGGHESKKSLLHGDLLDALGPMPIAIKLSV